MNKKLLMLLLIFFLIVIHGCNSSYDKVENKNKNNKPIYIKIGWEFDKFEEEGVPFTDLFLIVDSNVRKKYKVGQFPQYLKGIRKKDNNYFVLPDNYLLGCYGTYAGVTDIFIVVRSNEDTLSVKHKIIDEGIENEEENKNLEDKYEDLIKITIKKEAEVIHLSSTEK